MAEKDLAVPKGVKVETSGDELVISWRGENISIGVILLLSGIIIAGIIFPVAFQDDWIVAVVTFVFCGFMAITGLAQLFGKTVVRINESKIHYRRILFTLPWFGNKQVASAEVEKVVVEEIMTSSGKGGPVTTYEFQLVTKSGDHQKLFKRNTGKQRLLYLKQELERFLGV